MPKPGTAQADFLVKMAGRKLWSDQDVTTAAILLKSARCQSGRYE
ncbi:uroporphyrinogen III C-methyltransferase [Yersinia enterocolitica subsp. enterocolitica]|nr:uroporphyrinogen III C-methyltransferase [Yersinia enterocolitica subsp. enterocolitica]